MFNSLGDKLGFQNCLKKAQWRAHVGQLKKLLDERWVQVLLVQVIDCSEAYQGLKKIFGAAASLVISSLGARQGERAFRAARFTEQELLKSALKDPLLLDVLLRTPTRELKEFSVEELRPVYSWLYGSGVIPAQYNFQDFFQEAILGRGKEEREAREEAIRMRGGQRSDSPFATQRPVPPQASATQVTPPLVAQASTPTFQTPALTAQASPVSRQQFAAAFPV